MPDPSSDPTISQAAPDAAEPAAPATVEPPPPAAQANQATDLGRRRFFRTFAGDVFQTAATMAGAAQALQRASAEAASLILNPDGAADAGSNPGTPGGDGGAAGSVGSGGFRTPFREDADTLYIVDQRRLPGEIVEYPCRSAGEVAFAIRSMVVRGAPAIGQVAAIGLALSAEKLRDGRPYARRATLRGSANALTNARPTVRNVGWAMDRVMARYAEVGELSEDGDAIADAIRAETDAIIFEATTDHGRMASFGAEILPAPDDRPLRILTHGTTGTLAGGQYGTALGIVQAAHHAGRDLHVWVDETRPSMAGARVTAWELVHADIPHTLLPDAAAGHLLARGEVDIVLVGADRVAANGDTANDAGTYALGVLAARHDVPLFVCAPLSTVDLETADGTGIVIEERAADEVLEIRGQRIAPAGTKVRNPASDVTPAELITGIVTEEGVIRAPFEPGLRAASAATRERWAAMPGFREIGPPAASPSTAVVPDPDPEADPEPAPAAVSD